MAIDWSLANARMTPYHYGKWRRNRLFRKKKKQWLDSPHLQYIDQRLVDLAYRRIRFLLLCAPPRYGKSELGTVDLASWWLGTFPDDQIILSSNEATLAQLFSGKARDALKEDGRELWDVEVKKEKASEWTIKGHEGIMRAVGIGGSYAGRGADLLLVDDPFKNEQQAFSQTIRDRVMDWYNWALDRLEPNGVVLLNMHRWHEDDPVGRLLGGATADQYTLCAMPEKIEDEQDMAIDCLGRKMGDVLWEARWSKEEVKDRKKRAGAYWWMATHQQRPKKPGGVIMRREWFSYIRVAPKSAFRLRYWDLAGTEGDNDYTAGALISLTTSGLVVIEHVLRGQWEPGGVHNNIVQTAKHDGRQVYVRIEQEGGGGAGVGIRAIKNDLRGFNVSGDPVRIKKRLRWDPLIAQIQNGNCYLLEGVWNRDFVDEGCLLPNAPNDDQWDAAAGAYLMALELRKYTPRIYSTVKK